MTTALSILCILAVVLLGIEQTHGNDCKHEDMQCVEKEHCSGRVYTGSRKCPFKFASFQNKYCFYRHPDSDVLPADEFDDLEEKALSFELSFESVEYFDYGVPDVDYDELGHFNKRSVDESRISKRAASSKNRGKAIRRNPNALQIGEHPIKGGKSKLVLATANGQGYNFFTANEMCQAFGANLLFLEDEKEVNDLIKHGEKVFGSNYRAFSDDKDHAYFLGDGKVDTFRFEVEQEQSYTTGYFWLSAYYDYKSEKWFWYGTKNEINWHGILSEDNLKVVTTNDEGKRCLLVRRTVGYVFNGDASRSEIQYNLKKGVQKINRIIIRRADCAEEFGVICKFGYYDNTCTDKKSNICCYSPSFNYYLGNVRAQGSPSEDFKSDCFMEIHGLDLQGRSRDAATLPCFKVLHELRGFAPTRIDGSYYYLSYKPCVNRRAVISSERVHQEISRQLLAKMITQTPDDVLESEIFGFIDLRYISKLNKFIWKSLGQTIDYYDVRYWSGGRPNYPVNGDQESYCVVYRRRNNKFTFSWTVVEECNKPLEYLNVCEIPIRVTDLMPKKLKSECGQRKERGVLARSYYDSGHELQALLGEFNWMVAVNRQTGGGSSEFACSGALVNPRLVLVAAHCVLGGHKRYTVSLGAYNLGGSAILKEVVIGLSDVIINPGFSTVSPLYHDIALLQLETRPHMMDLPHVGLGCLPYPETFFDNTGAWECFALGWQSGSGIMYKLSVEIVPASRCRFMNKVYYHNAKHGPGDAYDKSSGYHAGTYNSHRFLGQNTPDLICAREYHSDICLDDGGTVLMCRQAAFQPDLVFHTDPSVNRNYKPPSHPEIVNSYGKRRFDNHKWYVMGLTHSSSPCGGSMLQRRYRTKERYMTFTSVKEYLPFIHVYADLQTGDETDLKELEAESTEFDDLDFDGIGDDHTFDFDEFL